MQTLNLLLLIVLVILVLIVFVMLMLDLLYRMYAIYFNNNNNKNQSETFRSVNYIKAVNYNDPKNDGKLKYKYLYDTNNTSNIVNKYVINDDKKINSNRVIYHPYQLKQSEYYGNPYFIQNIPNGRGREVSNTIYNIYGIRR